MAIQALIPFFYAFVIFQHAALLSLLSHVLLFRVLSDFAAVSTPVLVAKSK